MSSHTRQWQRQNPNTLEAAFQGTKDILSEPLYIKEKCARLFVEVAKRMWPGPAWEDADRFLRGLYDTNVSWTLVTYTENPSMNDP